MASLITHVVLAEKVFDGYFKGRERKDFMIGTCFPDIRFLGIIDRDQTHYTDVVMDDLSKDSDFIAGMMFHSIVDRAWTRYTNESEIISLCPCSKYISYSIKSYEDWLLYDRNERWVEDRKFFDDVLDEEDEFVGSKYRKEVTEWHKIIQDYFENSPDEESIRNFGIGLRSSESIEEEVIANYRIIKSEEKIKPLIFEFYDSIEMMF